MKHEIIVGDCLDVLTGFETGCIDLTITSPPYTDARTYDIGFKLKGQAWVDWCIPRIVEMCRVTNGLVFFNAAGKVKQFKYQPVVEWLVADLTRNHGIVCGPAPYVFARVGIPGSGAKHYHRRDWEPVYSFCRPEVLPLKWSDNTATGHAPRWALGGAMSNRTKDGRRKNARNKPETRAARLNQWGHSIDSGATVTEEGGVVRSRGKRPSHVVVNGRDQWGGTLTETSGEGRHVNGEHKTEKVRLGTGQNLKGGTQAPPPAIANSGNVIRLTVGGGAMGSRIAHENEAPFPEGLPDFFIRSYCPPGGSVCDPFMGSGTVLAVAKRLGRNGIGIDIRESQAKLTRRRLAGQKSLFDG